MAGKFQRDPDEEMFKNIIRLAGRVRKRRLLPEDAEIREVLHDALLEYYPEEYEQKIERAQKIAKDWGLLGTTVIFFDIPLALRFHRASPTKRRSRETTRTPFILWTDRDVTWFKDIPQFVSSIPRRATVPVYIAWGAGDKSKWRLADRRAPRRHC